MVYREGQDRTASVLTKAMCVCVCVCVCVSGRPCMGVSKNRGTPKSWVFPYKPSILGYPYFWKHPYQYRENANCSRKRRGYGYQQSFQQDIYLHHPTPLFSTLFKDLGTMGHHGEPTIQQIVEPSKYLF